MAVKAESARHKWEACPNASEAQIQAVEKSIKWTHGVKWAAFARCNYCWAPQGICNRWEESSSADEFQRRRNALCQWDGVLQHAVAALLASQASGNSWVFVYYRLVCEKIPSTLCIDL
jgi:hypothetical protein